MKGSYRIIVQNAALRYDFEISRNITIIKGESATGKTTLIEMIREFYENGESSGIELHCEKTCSVLAGRDWKPLLETMKDRIVFIDEGNAFVASTDFARAVQNSDNYYVIVTREGLANLPYSVEEIYGIRESGKYASLKKVYQELYHIYGDQNYSQTVEPSKIIVEDSNSGFAFFQGIAEGKPWTVVSAGGKSNVFEHVMRNEGEKNILIIADGAAFGAEMDRLSKAIKDRENIVLYLPESFEWIILKSGIINERDVEDILLAPQNYIDSQQYFSWERFFVALLIKKTEGSYLAYSKRKLNPVYLQDKTKEKICSVMKGISLL